MKKISIKKPNLIAIVERFLPVWLFSRSDAIWAIFNFWVVNGYNKIQRPETNSQEPTIWVKYSWIKSSLGHNSTSESIDKDWTFIPTHHQRNSSPASNVGRWILQPNSFRRSCFITKVATAFTVDNKLCHSGVAGRSLSTANFFIPLGLPTWLHCLSRVVQSQSHLLRVEKLQSRKALKDGRMKAVVNKLLRIHPAFIS